MNAHKSMRRHLVAAPMMCTETLSCFILLTLPSACCGMQPPPDRLQQRQLHPTSALSTPLGMRKLAPPVLPLCVHSKQDPGHAPCDISSNCKIPPWSLWTRSALVHDLGRDRSGARTFAVASKICIRLIIMSPFDCHKLCAHKMLCPCLMPQRSHHHHFRPYHPSDDTNSASESYQALAHRSRQHLTVLRK
jgi:hypothetical protein